MIHHLRLCLVLCIAWLPRFAAAETINPIDRKLDVCGRYEVFHINGIRSSFQQASANLNELIRYYGNAHDGHLINYFVAHNRSAGTFADLFQSWQQIVRDFPDITWELVVGAFNGIGQPLTPAQMAILRERLAGFRIVPPAHSDPDFQYVLSQIRYYHQESARMLTVAHSQGSLFANEVFDALAAGEAGPVVRPDTMGIVAVANFTTGLRGAFSGHVTSQRDVPVNLARAFVSTGILAPDVNLPFMAADLLGHNLIGVYLAAAASRAAIVNQMGAVLSQLGGAPNSLNLPASGSSIQDYRLAGGASWNDCTPPGIPGSFLCGGFDVPIVTYMQVGVGGVTRPGALGEIGPLAWAQANACMDAALAAWNHHRGPAPGRYQNYTVNGCGASNDLSVTYSVLRSSDGLTNREDAFITSNGRQAGHGVTVWGVCRTPAV